MSSWRFHPGVRSRRDLSFGERAADRMKGVFATWTALIGILVAMAFWMATNGLGVDRPPWIGLNLALSCIAALQCFILLIAAKRQDQISSELAQHDYDADIKSSELLETLAAEFALLRGQHAEQTAQLATLVGQHGTTTLPPTGGDTR